MPLPGIKTGETDMNQITTLEAVQNDIYRMAIGFVNGDTDAAGDIVSKVNLTIIENGEQNATKSFILQRASWVAFNHIDAGKTYVKYVGSIEDEFETETEEDDADWSELVADEASSPEEILLQSEYADTLAQAIESLTAEQKKIVKLLDKGLSFAEISRKMGISRAAVSQKMSAIRQSIAVSM
jgi:RNA polymerase sigma factor (sigma-70 family)